MTDHASIAERYRRAFYGGDLRSLREVLTEDFTFTGPVATYHGVDRFLKSSDHVAGVVSRVEARRVFEDGDEVCAILTIVADHAVARFTMVEWYRFRGDRIASVETVFDTGPFVRQSRTAATNAIDPVCGMAVAAEAAAATRTHEGRTYYFCSGGCAIAFEESPERYLAAG